MSSKIKEKSTNSYFIFQQKKSRAVTQYHYTTWPDHGTPDPLSLVVFHSHVMRTRTNQNEAPVVVHCRSVETSTAYANYEEYQNRNFRLFFIFIGEFIAIYNTCWKHYFKIGRNSFHVRIGENITGQKQLFRVLLQVLCDKIHSFSIDLI